MDKESCDIGLIGLAVMGQNLVLNMNDHGYRVAVFNRTVSKVDDFIKDEAKGTQIVGAHSIEELIQRFEEAPPRHADGESRRYGRRNDRSDSCPISRRATLSSMAAIRTFRIPTAAPRASTKKAFCLSAPAFRAVRKGARHGPSIMPGGNPEAWPHVKDIFQSIAAKVEDGTPCCDWVGEDGAGHYVKMVHNGIEYGDMQLICEAYQLLKDGFGAERPTNCTRFSPIGTRVSLIAILIEITAEILAKKDEDGKPMIDKILDTAGQKGTGKWTAISALDFGMPVTLIGEAVFGQMPLCAKGRASRRRRKF